MKSKRHNKRLGTRSGFTLIEMLVVIAIIALLASLMVPATQRALSSAKAIQTASNLRSTGTLMHAYAVDHGGHFPWAVDLTIPGGEPLGTWKYQILNWAGGVDTNRSLFYAPSSPFKPNIMGSGDWLDISFSMNMWFGQRRQSGEVVTRRPSLDEVKRPSSVILLATGGQHNNTWGNFAQTVLWVPAWQANNRNPSDLLPLNLQVDVPGGLGYWVQGSAAVCMVDGHVTRIKRGETTWGHLYPFK